MDRPKRIVVNVETGWTDIVKGQILIKSSLENVKLLIEETSGRISCGDNGVSDHGRDFSLDLTDSEIVLFGEVTRKSDLCFSIPFTAPVDQTSLDVPSAVRFR